MKQLLDLQTRRMSAVEPMISAFSVALCGSTLSLIPTLCAKDGD
ncbi:hypothetical protein [Pseudonocardia sp. TRM90224]|nr:hypothetical protein [Pseudonocardia sp. TRM90224]